MSETGQSPEVSKTSKQGNGSKIVIIILLVAILAAAGIIIYLLMKPEPEEPVESRGTVITEENVSDVMIGEEVSDAYYEASQTIDWHFKGVKSEDAYVANKTTNSRTVYFDLNLESTGETIYSSPYIPVGSELKGLSLDKELEPGTYDTVLIYHLVDDDEKEVSSVNVGLTIYVE